MSQDGIRNMGNVRINMDADQGNRGAGRLAAALLAGAACLAGTARAQSGYLYTIDTLPKEAQSGPVAFRKVKIANQGTIESCAFGDFDKDGKLDAVSGNDWFKGPALQVRRRFRLLSTADRTTPDDMTVTFDADGDGYDDVVSGGHNFGLFWYRNPGKDTAAGWERYAIDAERPPDGRVDTAVAAGLPHNLGWHSGGLVDVDGDGKAQELLSTGVRASAKMNMRWWKFGNGAWMKHDLGAACDQWGSGVGDINGDGRGDILCPDAWFEAPVDRVAGKWVKHPFLSDICNVPGEPEPKFKNAAGFTSGHATQIYAYDVDKDGLNDLILSSGHGNGVFWYKQRRSAKGEMTFLERAIDTTCYQPHNLEFKDIDGDGKPDLVTGKRWGGWGPGETGPNYVYWYKLTPGSANPWRRYSISYGEHFGMGTKGEVRDFDGDGDADVLATSGDQGGTVLFVNESKSVTIALPGSIFPLRSREGWGATALFGEAGAQGAKARDARGRLRAGKGDRHAR